MSSQEDPKPKVSRGWLGKILGGLLMLLSGFVSFLFIAWATLAIYHSNLPWLGLRVALALVHLTSLDFYVSYWAVGPVGHTFVSFNFDNAEPLCISIETRPEVGEGFSPIASLFKQFELIYVAGDERDLVGVRTNHREEDVFLYRIRIGPAIAREFLKVYLDRINELADHPEFYHLLSNSCTINIARYANKIGRVGRLDINHLLNGFIDQYLFSSGMIDTNLPFEEIRRLSHINEAAGKADGSPDFAQRIRQAIRIPKY